MAEEAGSSEADTQIVQNQTKSRVPGDIMFLVSRRHIATLYGSEKAITWLLFSILYLFGHIFGCFDLVNAYSLR